MVRCWQTTESQRHWRSTNAIVAPIAGLNPKEKPTPIRVTQSWGTMFFALGKNMLDSTAQIKVGSANVHRSSIFPGIKSVMADSDAAVRFWTEVRTWTCWTELKVQFRVQRCVWTEPKVQFKVQPVLWRFEPEPNLGLKLVNNHEIS